MIPLCYCALLLVHCVSAKQSSPTISTKSKQSTLLSALQYAKEVLPGKPPGLSQLPQWDQNIFGQAGFRNQSKVPPKKFASKKRRHSLFSQQLAQNPGTVEWEASRRSHEIKKRQRREPSTGRRPDQKAAPAIEMPRNARKGDEEFEAALEASRASYEIEERNRRLDLPSVKSSAKSAHEKSDFERALEASLQSYALELSRGMDGSSAVSQSVFDADIQEAIAASLKSDNSGADSSFVLDKRPGRLGVTNLGNTCYLSSVLQVLGHSGRFLNLLFGTQFLKPHPVQEAFVELIRQMWTNSKAGSLLDPTQLSWALHDYKKGLQFHPHNVEDAHEALKVILGILSDSSKSMGANPFGESPFDAAFSSVISRPKFCHCGHVHEKEEMEQDLLLIIPPPAKGRSSVSLYDCFDIWREFEVLPNYQCPDNEFREKDDVVRMNVFKEGGDILLIVLRRFDHDRNKIHTKVEYPIQLDISRITGDSSNPNKYSLSGVIHHNGETPRTGHYVSQFFHEEHKEWVDANDRSVVKHQGALDTASSTAYILLYQRVGLKKVTKP